MSKCKICGGPMKPLFVSEFCPKDCDKKPAQPVKVVQPGDPEYADFWKDFYSGTFN